MSYNVKDYDTYTRSFKYSNPYSSGGGFTANADVSTLMQNSMPYQYGAPLPTEKKRSNLDRVLDVLSTPLYATAGIVRGAIDPNFTMLEGFTGGIRAGNPFGGGYEKGEHTYSKVLESAGWKPTSTLGKVAKGALGFVGDVFLDPSTYLTLGTSAVVKGTGKAGLALKEADKITELAKGLGIAKDLNGVDDVAKIAKATFDNTVEKFAGNANINKDLVERLATKKADDAVKSIEQASKVMTQDTAESIIKSQAQKRGVPITAEDITRDAGKLVETYNKVSGINRKAEGITLSLSNAPFGKKIFGKYADKSVELKGAEDLMKLGDNTVAPYYAKLRDSIYGSKLGGLFSSTSALYKASKADPAKVYDFLKFTEYTRGLTKDMLESEKLIRDKAKAMNMTPSETKEVLDLMQDKSVWGKVASTVKFLDTSEAKQYKEKILKQQGETKAKLDELTSIKSDVETLKHAKETELLDTTDALDALDNNYNRELFQLDTSRITKSEDIQRTLKMYEEQLKGLDNEIAVAKETKVEVPKAIDETIPNKVEVPNTTVDDFSESIKMHDEYKDAVKQRTLQKEGHKTLINTLTEATDQEVAKSLSHADAFAKPVEMSSNRYRKMIKDINESGKVTYKSKRAIADFEKLYPTWEKVVTTIDGKVSVDFIPPKEVMNEFKKVSSLAPDVVSATKLADKIPVIDKISEQLYGEAGKISRATWDSNVETVVQMMRDGVSKEGIQMYIEKNARFYNGKAQVMYPFIAKQLGYGEGTRIASWEEFYTKPVEKIYEKAKSGKLTPTDEKKLLELQKANFKRQYLIKQFDETKSMSEAMKIVQEQADRELEDIMYNVKGLNSTSSKGILSDEEIIRQKAGDNAYATDKMKYSELANKDVVEASTGSDRERYLQEIFSRINSKSLEGTKGFDLDKAGEQVVRWANKVTDEIDSLLKDFFGKSYLNLTDKQKDLMYNMAIKNANAKMSGAEMVGNLDKETANQIAKEIATRAEEAKKVISESDAEKAIGDIIDEKKTVDNVSNPVDKIEQVVSKSEITADVLNQREDLVNTISETKDALKSLDVEYKTSYQNMLDNYVKSTDELKTKIKDIEETKQHLDNAFKIGEGANIDEYTRQLQHMDEVLASDDALETFLKSYLGEGRVDEILRNSNPEVGKIVLDTKPVSDKVKNLVKVLTGEFEKMGLDEVAIGKLTEEQRTAMVGQYVTHILTDEGRKLFASNKEINKIIPNFGDDLGYGRKFNPYSMSRQIHDLPDGKGGLIHNPTIEQINEFFAPMVKGKNVMATNIADIYLARALKHTELMYDFEYTNTMMNRFGKAVDKTGEVESGYKAVANYGNLKSYIKDKSKLQTNIDLAMIKSQGGKVTQGQFKETLQNNVMKLIDELGLDPHVLDDMATPMVELNKEQIAKIQRHNPDLIKQVNDVIVQKANQGRKLQMAKDQSKFLQLYDKFTHFIKLNQTTVLPSFHIRNKLSNTFNNWLNIGTDAVNPEFQKRTFLAIKNGGNVEGVLKITKEDGSIGAISWKELYENAKKYGVIDDGYFAQDVGAGASSSGILKKLSPKFDPTDTKNFFMYKKGAEVGSLIESSDRLLHFASEISRGKSFESATESVNKFLFDYSDLTAFEATYMKRVIPYYTWLRKNSSLQLKMMLEDPKKFQYVSKVLGGIEGMTNEEDKMNKDYVNDFAQDWVQTPFNVTNPDGKQEPVMINPNLPFMDVSRIPNPLHPIDSIKNLFTQSNPLIKVPVEQAINKNVFFDSPIVKEGDNELAKRLDHIASQFALYGTAGDLINKSGADWKLQALNTATGVKAVSYDYEKYKAMKIQEMLDKIKGTVDTGKSVTPVAKSTGKIAGKSIDDIFIDYEDYIKQK